MNLPYLLRLACLCLASFFLVHAVLGLVTWIVTPGAIRLAERMRPRAAARLLLALRMLPVGLAMFVVGGLCVPSYLLLEPGGFEGGGAAERVGVACCAAALLGVVVWGISIARVLRAMAGSLRYTRRCEQMGDRTRVAGEAAPVLVVEDEAPVVALAGVMRSRLVVSRGVVRALSVEQLAAALRHEEAHRASRDNLKRLVLLVAPDILPFARVPLRGIERGWARFAEWAADDWAIEGDARRSLSLASALVCVARMGAAARTSPLVASLLPDRGDLSARVDRLLRTPEAVSPPFTNQGAGHPAMRAVAWSAAVVLGGFLVAAMMRPGTFYSVHWLLERLVR
jgi:hypothetical protein